VCLLAWLSTSFPRPPAKRAVALALINAFSQLGNVAGSYVWPKPWGPTYRNSYGIVSADFQCCRRAADDDSPGLVRGVQLYSDRDGPGLQAVPGCTEPQDYEG